jgi:hypothetical protein
MQLRDLAAARVFGWDNDKPGVQFNQLVVIQQQLEQMRALRDVPFKNPTNEGDTTDEH